ncbi:MAG: DUF1318 domain-containing protein [Lysobacterales bacterium CG02_land_8_20_14_3_00_62_12]|nr:MAG: DUF1318 domain-containing protein [Xanthomonadales bacterium CG02_land_8_20_14_3_00_62_12]
MKTRYWTAGLLLGLIISACVTINVYFPEAEVQQAAGQFIDQIIGTDPAPGKTETVPDAPGQPLGFSLSVAWISSAQAAADLNVATPAIRAIQSRMAERFESALKKHFDSGALGLKNDGLIELRDAAAVALADRAPLKQAVADDNRDRAAVYREIALANQHPEWEAEIRSTFAAQWIAKAHTGWFYQNAKGGWVQK